MRLIDCCGDSLRMQEFIGRPPLPFAILSHTWDTEEVNFQVFNNIATRTAAKGWTKIEQTCREAQRCGFHYVWIDSCCIDKTNNAELSESINSMFRWYSEAALCLVYLNDFDANAAASDRDTMLRRARWFSRGWTLQEIVAARAANFYDSAWCHFGTRASLRNELTSITKIDAEVFSLPQNSDVVVIRDLLDSIPVGRRMAWAATRQTTRPEDMAYCLIGLFSVSMPMLYGEGGQQAFIRLQEEIIRDNNDLSLFAWRAGDCSTYRGILALSPHEFIGLSNLKFEQDMKFNPDFAMSNKGLRINTFLKPSGDTHSGSVVLPLHCYIEGAGGEEKPPQLGLILKHEGASVYVRTRPDVFASLTAPIPISSGNTIFISKRVRRAATTAISADHTNATSSNLGAVYFTIPGINARVRSERHRAVKLLEVEPRELWDAHNNVFVTRGLRSFTSFLKFHIRDDDITIQAVMICGFTENDPPWALVDDDSSDLFQVTARRDFHMMAKMGLQTTSFRQKYRLEKHDLGAIAPSTGTWARYVSATVQCDQIIRNKEMALVVSLEVFKGPSVFSSLLRKLLPKTTTDL
jgi:hypothetical protein